MAREPKENISITIPMTMLPLLDLHCRENDLERSQVINRAIRLYLGTKIAKLPGFWEREYHRLETEGKI